MKASVSKQIGRNSAMTKAKARSSVTSGDKIIDGDLQELRREIGTSHTLGGQIAALADGFQKADAEKSKETA